MIVNVAVYATPDPLITCTCNTLSIPRVNNHFTNSGSNFFPFVLVLQFAYQKAFYSEDFLFSKKTPHQNKYYQNKIYDFQSSH